MSYIRKFAMSAYLVLIPAILSSCVMTQVRSNQVPQEPAAIDAAVRSLVGNLMSQVKRDRGIFIFDKISIVIDPFIDATSNEIPKVSTRIETIIIEESRQQFGNFHLARLTSENLRNADYLMNGTIRPHLHEGRGGYYQVSASVVSLKTGKIVGRSDVRISDQNLDYTPAQIYQDSPMYLKDPPLEGAVSMSTGPVGALANTEYYNALEIMAMLVEAETAYGKQNYEKALALLNAAATRPDGQLMKTYAGLYSTNRRLGRMDMAEQAFAKLLSISVEKNNVMTIKFLFDVNSVDFWRDPDLRKQYALWLRQIGTYFHDRPYCLRVVGHCSRTGTERYNKGLSLERARRIQELLKPYFPTILERSQAIGKGYKENIKGIGTDDERDAIDRRVEFFVTGCDSVN